MAWVAAAVWSLLPLAGFVAGRMLPLPARVLPAPIGLGLVGGLLAGAAAAAGLEWRSVAAYEEPLSFLFLSLLGLATVRWTIRAPPNPGESAIHAASFAVLLSLGAVAAQGGARASLALVAGLAVGLGSGLFLTRQGPTWVVLALGTPAAGGALLAQVMPWQRIVEASSAFALGAFLAALLAAPARLEPRQWPLAAACFLFALVPWLLATG